METTEVLDVMGSLISQLKAYAAKLPPVVHLSVAPAGIKPKPESVEVFEQALVRFRAQSSGSSQRAMNEYLVESLEAFEAGKLLGAVQPLLAVLDHLDRMRRDNEITVTAADEKRLTEYRTALTKILPGSQPELEGAGRGM
ncbi:MAG TPA: hypothetical protein VJ805_09125 [Nitrospiraceae bacterium]|nr:hypothetical protein [Nitrospiraceae bacterium]